MSELTQSDIDALLYDLASFASDPVGFAYWAFPWGEAGTILENEPGLEAWQLELLQQVKDGLSPTTALRIARVSGNGIGKSALVAILLLWMFTTYPDTLGVVTANTENQLKTKTWASLGKWFNLFIARDLFRLTATALMSKDPERERTWRCDMIPWSEGNPAAFQGLHNKGKRQFIVFDEASMIADVIWEAADGCMTDDNTERLWFAFGNPNQPTGRFRDCFAGGAQARLWRSASIDSRTVRFTDKTELNNWVESYGEDHDFVRVRVRGVFPRAGSMEFISATLAAEALSREAVSQPFDPLVIGVDVARFGDDASVIYFRKGRDGTRDPIILRNVDTMTLAGRVAAEALRLRPDAIFVDETGVGGGVVDRLRQLRVNCVGINFAKQADRVDPDEPTVKYANKRAEMWGMMRKWLSEGAIRHPDLAGELPGPQYAFNQQNAIQLERKEDMKRRNVASPDIADALALTFAYPVIPNAYAGGEMRRRDADRAITEYDMFDYAKEH